MKEYIVFVNPCLTIEDWILFLEKMKHKYGKDAMLEVRSQDDFCGVDLVITHV